MSIFKPKRANSNPWGAFIIFTLVGLAFIAVPFIANPAADESWVETTGTIVGHEQRRSSDSGTMYTPIASFEAGGVEYTATTNFSSGSRSVEGSEVAVAYDPQNPQNARIVGGAGQVMMLVFPVAGAVAVLIGVYGLVSSIIRSRQIRQLKSNGTKITGVLADTASTSRKYWVVSVAAQGPDGQVRTYKSDQVSGISSLQMSDYKTNPVPIDVYVNPMNPENYYVDIDDIPQISPQRLQDLLSQTIGKGFSGGVTPQSSVAQPEPVETVEPPFPTSNISQK